MRISVLLSQLEGSVAEQIATCRRIKKGKGVFFYPNQKGERGVLLSEIDAVQSLEIYAHRRIHIHLHVPTYVHVLKLKIYC